MTITYTDMDAAILLLLWRRKKKHLLAKACMHLAVERPLVPDERFSLDNYSDADCKIFFRFDRAGIQQLSVLLRLPSVIITGDGDRSPVIEALAVVLFRLTYPVRYSTQVRVFGRSTSSLCRIFLTTIDHIYQSWRGHLNFPLRLLADRVPRYCTSIMARGGAVQGVFGFIDGTKVATCRIWRKNNLQKVIYSGHKRQHCLSFQCVTAPDGLCIHFYGPVEGRSHDSTMLRLSGLREKLAEHDAIFDGRFLYGDPAYGISRHMIAPYKGATLTEEQQQFNRAMSSVREAVEWSFGRMKTLWAAIDFKKQNKVMLSPVGKLVHVAMLLTNCHCCYNRGNQIGMYFDLEPPLLSEYLALE